MHVSYVTRAYRFRKAVSVTMLMSAMMRVGS